MSQTISGTYKLPPMMSRLVGSPYGAYSYPVKTTPIAPIAPITPQMNYNTSNINANIPRPAQFTNQPTPYVPQLNPANLNSKVVENTALQVLRNNPNVPAEGLQLVESIFKRLSGQQLIALMNKYNLIPESPNKQSFIEFIEPYLSGPPQSTISVAAAAAGGRRRRYRSTKKGRKNRKH